MIAFAVLLALLSPVVPPESELQETVVAYWTLMARGDRAGALKFVLPDSLNDFIARQEPKIQSFRYLGAEKKSQTEALVTVEMEGIFKTAQIQGVHKIERHETWVRDGNAWKLKVEKASLKNLAVFGGGSAAQTPLPKVLDVRPSVLKIAFLNYSSQRGRVRILNGTDKAAEVVSIKYDESRFQLVDPPRHIAPGTTSNLILKYTGTENDKNLTSRLSLVLKHDGQQKLFEVPVVYNYLSKGTRGLFGLSEEEARKLKRGDRPKPALQAPPGAAKPGLPIPKPNEPSPPAQQR